VADLTIVLKQLTNFVKSEKVIKGYYKSATVVPTRHRHA